MCVWCVCLCDRMSVIVCEGVCVESVGVCVMCVVCVCSVCVISVCV